MISYEDQYQYFLSTGRLELADSALVGSIVNLRYALQHVNYLQFRDKLKAPLHDTVKRILLSKPLIRKLRIIKFALVWLRSIFRPFIDKEKHT